MYFQFACPTCQKNLKVREENAGSRVRCPYCHTTLTVKSPRQDQQLDEREVSDSHILSEQSSSESVGDYSMWSASGTDVNMLRSALFGLCGALAFYVIVWPFRDFLGFFSTLFLDRGWVPFVLVFLMSWSMAILYLKSKKLTRQKDSMLFDLLPSDLAEDITVRTVHQFTSHIRSLPTNPNESFLINRVLRGLEHFRGLQSNSEVAGRLASQSEIDATAVESSYTTLKVFIWAIPILGFIGTVIGISGAVSGFSGSLNEATEMSVLKDSLNGVTSGLATAFDTTLIALVMSLLVMFPTSSMQKSEEDLLNLVDEYCNENLLKRLKDAGRAGGGMSGDYTRTIQKAIDAAMADHHAELKTWSKKLESIGETLTQQVVSGWSNIDGQIQTNQKDNIEQLRSSLGGLLDRQQEIVSKLDSLGNDQGEQFRTVISGANEEARAIVQRTDERQERVEQDMSRLVDQFEKTLTGMIEQSESVRTQMAETMQSSTQSLGDHFSALSEGLASLNSVLEKIGEKHAVLEVRDGSGNQQSRGWGFFRKKNGVR